jgi:Signal peptidase I
VLADTPTDSERDREHGHDQDWGWREYLRATGWAGLLVCLLAVALIIANGGVPVVATVTSGSMAPNINQGDTVVLDTHDAVVPVIGSETEVVTAVAAREQGKQDKQSFNEYGSVIMFRVPESDTAILHRAHLRVEAGENWVPRANASYLANQDCAAITHCPAPHDGIITKGDRNDEYDQVNGIAPPVRDDWIRGVARSQGIPFLPISASAS